MGLLDLFTDTRRAPAECVIEVGGEEIADLYPSLMSVDVDADRSRATTAVLVFETRRLEDGTWSVQDDPRLTPWAPMVITAVFGGEREEVMRGWVKQVRTALPAAGEPAQVTVDCQDDSLALDRTHVTERWGADAAITDGAIAAAIAGRNGLGLVDTPGDGQTGTDLVQNETDIRFLKRRARANGFEVLFREGRLWFGPMRLDAEPQATLMLQAGPATNCLRLDIDDDGHRPDRVAFQVATDDGSEAPVEELTPDLTLLGPQDAGSEDAGLEPFVWRPRREGVTDATQMRALAQQLLNAQSLRIRADGELDGTLYGHVLRVGEPVGVDGVGTRYGGVWYVDAAQHRFDADGYRVTFRLLRNARGDNLSASSHPLAGVV